MVIKTILEEKIRAAGHTKKSFAEKMGMQAQNLNKMLESPSYPSLERMAAVLDIPLWQLLANDTEISKANTIITCPHCGKPIAIKLDVPGE